MRFVKVLFLSLRDFFRDGGVMLSASLSYFFMMAIVPFCLLIASLIGYLLSESQTFYNFFISKLLGFFPKTTNEVTAEIRTIVALKGVGGVSLAIYAFLSYQLFASLDTAMNAVFKVKKKRNFAISLLMSLVVVTALVVIAMVSFSLSLLIPMLKNLKGLVSWVAIGGITGFLLKYVVPFFLMFWTVVSIYFILPGRKVGFAHAVCGGLFTTTMLELAKHLFTWYVGSVAAYGAVYGSLTATVVFLLWVFYSSCIFLIGGEVVNNMGKK